MDSIEPYSEEDPTVKGWVRDAVPSVQDVQQYAVSLFPCANWIRRYNLQWLIGDLVAGITVGSVMVPQSMAYAALARLPPQFGLYSSFVGGMTYWFFATSKDISIGPIAVMATIVGDMAERLGKKHPDVPTHVIASLIALVAGIIITAVGLLRCGWIIDFISHTAISAFMTGSAITIMSTQIASLLGIAKADSRGAAYENFISALKNIKSTQIDAALGLTALFTLYAIKCLAKAMDGRRPSQRQFWFFMSTLRTVLVISVYTFISWGVNRHYRKAPKFAIVGNVPRGLQNISVPVPNAKLLAGIAEDLPIVCIVLLIEHVAIAKSFGRISNYQINPSQEMVGIGIANIFGSFFGAFPATGSFSRTAINSKAGVRTPFGAAVTSVLVLVAIYALPAVFFYIPKAPLAAVIIHAVGDLITQPKTVRQFWRVSPIEVPLFFAAVFTAIFYSIEVGVYLTIVLSIFTLLHRSARSRGHFLGTTKVYSAIQGKILQSSDLKSSTSALVAETHDSDYGLPRHLFLSEDRANSNIALKSPHPGIFIFRFSEGFNFHNANNILDGMTAEIFCATRRTAALSESPLNLLWSSESPRITDTSLPTLKAIIFDFSAVNHVDVTSIQTLLDIRQQLDAYAAPVRLQWHFANVHNRWTRRALGVSGFGSNEDEDGHSHIYSLVDLDRSLEAQEEDVKQEPKVRMSLVEVQELATDPDSISASDLTARTLILRITVPSGRRTFVTGMDRPFFHADLEGAVKSVLENLEQSAVSSDEPGTKEA